MRPRTLGSPSSCCSPPSRPAWRSPAMTTTDKRGEQTVTAIQPAPFMAGLAFPEPPSLRSANGRLRGTIVAKNGTITVSGIRVRNTQSYGIAGQQRGLLGPTLRVQPGDLVDLVLDNRLAPATARSPAQDGRRRRPPSIQQGGECAHDTTITPGHPQPTNFHFHGFHVTPRNQKVGKVTYYGDNVLACLRGGRSHIRFRIPRTHDQGTFWYHAHLHGLTDDQVFRGLAGMIVVGDSRRYLPSRFANVRTRALSLKDIQVSTPAPTTSRRRSRPTTTGPTRRTARSTAASTRRSRCGQARRSCGGSGTRRRRCGTASR